MNYSEHVVTFDCERDTLVGVLAKPSGSVADTAVVIIVGGPQYRAGSHRHFVLLSRALAASGFPVLRFDYRGMGDSAGEQRDFTDVTADIGTAIETMQAHLPSIKQIALWGLCDGASAALLYCHYTNDARVTGLCLLNPWVRSEASLARTHIKHYYARRLTQKEFWTKLFAGKVATAAIGSLWKNIRLMGNGSASSGGKQIVPFQDRMALAWRKFGGTILLLLSADDYTAKEFLEYVTMDPAWVGLMERPQLAQHKVPGADHTFSGTQSRHLVQVLTLNWLQAQTAR